jgi:hypothetical protein
MKEPTEAELEIFFMERFSANCMMLFENIGEYVEENHIVQKQSEWVLLAQIAQSALFELHRCVVVSAGDGPTELPNLGKIKQLTSVSESKLNH